MADDPSEREGRRGAIDGDGAAQAEARRAAIDAASRELAAARTLLLTPGVSPASARPHLEAATAGLAALGAATPTLPEPSARRRQLLRAVATLERARTRLEDRARLLTAPRARLLFWVLLLAPLAVFLLRAPIRGDGSWRAAYYADAKFEGEPIVTRDREIDFNWNRGPAIPELPPDKFSVRWDTCLVLAEPHDEVTFELASDDGSRLFVDGRRVIDNWGRHRMRREVEVVKLGPGVHHLRVDYFEHKSGAGITLAASLAGEVPASLPPALLRYPGDDMDPARPCAAITP